MKVSERKIDNFIGIDLHVKNFYLDLPYLNLDFNDTH